MTKDLKPTVGQLRRLIGNPNAYAQQRDDGAWYPVREPLTAAVLAKHLDGEVTVGTYVLDGDTSKTLVFDFDDPDPAYALHLCDEVKEILDGYGVPCFREFSGKKGYHLWVVLPQKVSGADLVKVGRGVRAVANQPKLEVFPKQAVAHDLGNLVKLPGALHRVSLEYSYLLDPMVTCPMERWFALVEKFPELPSLGSYSPTGDPNEESYPCLRRIQEGVGEGGRNTALLHLAGMFRRNGLSEDNLAHLVHDVNTKFDPPLAEDEVEAVLRQSQRYGRMCSQLDDDIHCGDRCVSLKFSGLSTKAGELKFSEVGDCVVMQVAERAGPAVRLSHPDMKEVKGALRQEGGN